MNSGNNKIVSVIIPLPVTEQYDYLAPFGTNVGDVVEVTFGKKKVLGVVSGIRSSSSVSTEKLKSIERVLGERVFSLNMLKFILWVSDYTVTPVGLVLKMSLSVPDAFKKIRERKDIPAIRFSNPELQKKIELSLKQQEAARILSEKINKGFSVSLLEGLTGSGKTEVYFEAVKEAIKRGHQVLVMVPEIMLTTQWIERFKDRFGCFPGLWHSDLSARRRRETWKGVLKGEVKVVVGARSSLFLPFSDLSLIVIDEEHDQSYKQEEGVIYQARDMAIVRAKIEGFPVILSSATPSLESVMNVRSGRYERVFLPERYKGAKMPSIKIIDMRKNSSEKISGERSWLSRDLSIGIKETISRGDQVLLFLNRRGYAPLKLCSFCGYRIQCPHCSAWLVEHKQVGRLMCHHCDYSIITPEVCPFCNKENSLVSCGPGVERLYEEVLKRYPEARTIMVTSDTLKSSAIAEEIVNKIISKEVDIIIGTQILAKGHHFPDLTLIGVVDADLGLEGGDMRASERTFQLIQQVSGRAGRSGKDSVTYLQSYQPENGVLEALVSGDIGSFLEAEASARRVLNMPPFGRLASLIISSSSKDTAYKTSQDLIKVCPPRSMGVEVLGPTTAPLSQLRGKYRFRFLVKSGRGIRLSSIIKEWLTKVDIPYTVRVQVDIDPYNFM